MRLNGERMLSGLRKRVDLPAAALSGLAAGAVYVATMEVDNRLSGIREDDLIFLGRPLVGDPARAKLAGIPVHAANSVALAMTYAALAHHRLPGPPWLRGMAFAAFEGTVLYPLTIFEQLNPAIRDGQIDRYFSFRAYLLSIPRHLTYGATLGAVYDRLRAR